MSKLAVSNSALLQRIREEHEIVRTAAIEGITHAIVCGKLIRSLQDMSVHGTFGAALDQIGMSDTTARRYMEVAALAEKRPKEVGYMLKKGKKLIDLYREFDLVKPCVGGGYRSEAYKKRRANEEAQQELPFQFEEVFRPAMGSFLNSRAVERLEPRTLHEIRNDFLQGLKRCDQLIARKTTIDIQA